MFNKIFLLDTQNYNHVKKKIFEKFTVTLYFSLMYLFD